MLNDKELDQIFCNLKTPEAGRILVRKIRADGPVRNLQERMDCVRTRLNSKKMKRALYAESRTVELPAIKIREDDKSTIEIWPQPCTVDMKYIGPSGGVTRNQHTPDIFLITDNGFEIEEWREEKRLQNLAWDRPHHFVKDKEGIWHYLPAEEHFAKLGICYRLRSADELPRVYFANIKFLEDYNLESSPPLPTFEEKRLVKLLDERKQVGHLELLNEHKYSADHIFQAILCGSVYVDLKTVNLSVTSELVLYASESIARADTLLRAEVKRPQPLCVLDVRPGARFMYDSRSYVVDLAGNTEVICHIEDDQTSVPRPLPLKLVQDLFNGQSINQISTVLKREYDLKNPLFDAKGLACALERFDAIQSGSSEDVKPRTMQRWKEKARGCPDVQSCLAALTPLKGGNRKSRLPEKVLTLAKEALKFHNQPNSPKVAATYSHYKTLCDSAKVNSMSQSSFYEWIKSNENQLKREGKRKVYQKAPIPLTFDFGDPVHGVLPHEVI